MGRRTWDSIPDSFKPLKDRFNLLISHHLNEAEVCKKWPGVIVEGSVEGAESRVAQIADKVDRIFVIGGGEIYREFFSRNLITHIYLTRIIRLTEYSECYEQDGEDSGIFTSKIEKKCETDDELKTCTIVPHFSLLCDRSSPDSPQSNVYSEEVTKSMQGFRLVSLSQSKRSGDSIYDFAVYSRSPLEKPVDTTHIISPLTSMEEETKSKENMESAKPHSDGITFAHPHLTVRDCGELQYLDAIALCLREGVYKDDRTGVGSLSIHGHSMRFDLKSTFPLLTTKKTFLRGVLEELLWFIKGDTDGNKLLKKKVNIWKENGTKEFLASRGIHDREEHDLGPIYGFQWRHFGAEYKGCNRDYSGEGFDQLGKVISQLKANPNDRRAIMCAWNVAALDKMALPPCHVLCQFLVTPGSTHAPESPPTKELSCLLYQRSCDIGLGVPFNIASYALLTRMIAQVCGFRAGELVHFLGDMHVYVNHIDQLQVQLKRVPRPFPVMDLNPNVKDIDHFTPADFTLKAYLPHDKIQMSMAV
eukprot:GHVN01094846.1.p1 GENE.GHVN01094846.1~~GHVN01094846.1.p1  ORF type:complete len:531 (-),score=84.48 GHVN01094846.1:151-1743(-)